MGARQTVGILAMAALIGCGSSGGSVGSFSTTVPPSTQLGQLSSAQLTSLCSDLNRYYTGLASNASLKQGSCKLAAVLTASLTVGSSTTDAQLQAACNQAYNQCLSGSSTTGQTLTCTETPPASCTATVAQYTACLNDNVSATTAAFASLPACNSLTVASLSADGGSGGGGDELPASCKTFSAACSDTGADLPDPTSSGP